jgi:hypothetical protein
MIGCPKRCLPMLSTDTPASRNSPNRRPGTERTTYQGMIDIRFRFWYFCSVFASAPISKVVNHGAVTSTCGFAKLADFSGNSYSWAGHFWNFSNAPECRAKLNLNDEEPWPIFHTHLGNNHDFLASTSGGFIKPFLRAPMLPPKKRMSYDSRVCFASLRCR